MSSSTVRLEIPAASGYLVLARTAVAAMCARLDYPLDRLEDVKLAVDEACSLLLSDTDSEETLTLALQPGEDGSLKATVSAVTRHGKAPKQSSFAWTVLSALVEDVSSVVEGGQVSIALQASRGDVAVAS
ncbi:MAG: anti-sigma regulatory factor [Candidatus Nanopelagicales bacterium]